MWEEPFLLTRTRNVDLNGSREKAHSIQEPIGDKANEKSTMSYDVSKQVTIHLFIGT